MTMRLDIGCGGNKKEGFLGIDIYRGPQVDLVMSATTLHLADNAISEVYSRRCIQHIADDAQAFREIYRVLQMGGRFELVVASWIGWLYYKIKWFGKAKNYPCFHLYTRVKLRRILRKVGFRGLEFSTVKHDIKVVCFK